jgi:hypothetical protein
LATTDVGSKSSDKARKARAFAVRLHRYGRNSRSAVSFDLRPPKSIRELVLSCAHEDVALARALVLLGMLEVLYGVRYAYGAAQN